MTLPLAVALLALLVALFALVALVAVYARVRALETTRAVELSGYAPLVGRPAPERVRPRAGETGALVAVVDADCAQCHEVYAVLGEVSRPGIRFAAVADRAEPFADSLAELVVDPDVRGELFEGYSPTLLALDARGVVTDRRFVHADTDVRGLLLDLIAEHEVARA